KARELIFRDWSIRIIHIFREGNRVADRLANHSHYLSFGFHHISSLLRKVQDCIRIDSVNIFFSAKKI
ncbi:Putative ribonuclease H protein At1g65750, partial [Linum grandiflorum]